MMGKEKYLERIKSLFEKSPVVDYGSIERIISERKETAYYARRLIHYLLAKGKIKRLAKGYYTTRNEISLAVFVFEPSYLGLQDALSFYNLWEQETTPVIITARKVRQGIRKVFGQNVLIRRISRKYLFGTEYYRQGEIALPYSDIEKTFIDMFYFNEVLSKKTLREFRKRIDEKKLFAYLKKYPKPFRRKVVSSLRGFSEGN